MKKELPHPLSGVLPLVGSPIRMSQTPVRYEAAPPTLGQHTHEVLSARLGVSEQELQRLEEAGVI
jgi:crotonobetainyl-CoA:carnitine CoA-transferase CaiB-like acyl-CoA transferase